MERMESVHTTISLFQSLGDRIDFKKKAIAHLPMPLTSYEPPRSVRNQGRTGEQTLQ